MRMEALGDASTPERCAGYALEAADSDEERTRTLALALRAGPLVGLGRIEERHEA